MNSDRTISGLKGFRDTRRKALDVAAENLVTTRTLDASRPLPLVIEPAVGDIDLAAWAQTSRTTLGKDLLEHGAILFRGFGLRNATDFERVCSAICDDLFAEYGDLPREGVSDRVYQSTPYPPDKAILFHNESSHLPSWPRKQFFMCVQPSREGGYTPILDCREVYRRLDPAIREPFETKGVMYVRNFVRDIDVSWQEFFHTEDRSQVEAACRKEGMSCEWTAGDGLRIRQTGPAVIKHPRTGEKVFF